MRHQRQLISKNIDKECEKVANKIIDYLIQLRPYMIYGEITDFKNVWEQFCFYARTEDNYIWYDVDTEVVSTIHYEMRNLTDSIKQAIIFQNFCEADSLSKYEYGQTLVYDDMIILDYIYDKYILKKALAFTNQE